MTVTPASFPPPPFAAPDFTGPGAPVEGARGLRAAVAVVVLLAALGTFLVLAGLSPFEPTPGAVRWLLGANALGVLLLALAVGREGLRVLRARRARRAGARLHARVVGLFSVVAAVPLAVVTVVTSITLDRGLDPWFSGSLREVVLTSDVIARAYQQQLCQNIGREMRLMAVDLERARRGGLYEADRKLFRDFMTSRAVSLGFPYAAILRRDGTVVERSDARGANDPPPPREGDFDEAASQEPPCLFTRRTLAAMTALPAVAGEFLYVGRPVDPRAYEFTQVARAAIAQYQGLEAGRAEQRSVLSVVYGLIAASVLLAAVWLGLAFANALTAPIRRLMQATDQVSSGNLYVQVPVREADGDIGRLGSTFNRMIADLRTERGKLLEARDLIDRRRRFTEAVLAGASTGVVGLDAEGRVTLLNPAAEAAIGLDGAEASGRPVAELIPAVGALVEEARAHPRRLVRGEARVLREGKERELSVRVATERGEGAGPGASADDAPGFVVTLDDITDLVAAQRTAAWADVARRIAHEIKNPLTPIQLAAERIKRKYGKVITQDRGVFDQCVDTIVRQVDDIKRMVDEFSSFARMPKPRPESADLAATARESLFLMRTAHPGIAFEDELPAEGVVACFDRRLLGQAVQNILKNATEAVAAARESGLASGRILVEARVEGADALLDVTDDGRGFPAEGRARLLEPYVTEREGGTGLGLPIVAKVLEEHGGALQLLDNPDGRGARVRLRLPRACPPVTDARSKAPHEATA